MEKKNTATTTLSPKLPVLTTPETEIELREKRAQLEPMQIQVLEEYPYPFVTYTVRSQTGVPYSVEIRSLADKINSCSCPDFQVNTLGTCKHIEGVLHYLKRSEKGKIPFFIEKGSPLIEIFSNPFDLSKTSVTWPNDAVSHELKKTVSSFFSANNTLISHPAVGVASIEHALSSMSQKNRAQIRISSHLQDWIVAYKQKEA